MGVVAAAELREDEEYGGQTQRNDGMRAHRVYGICGIAWVQVIHAGYERDNRNVTDRRYLPTDSTGWLLRLVLRLLLRLDHGTRLLLAGAKIIKIFQLYVRVVKV